MPFHLHLGFCTSRAFGLPWSARKGEVRLGRERIPCFCLWLQQLLRFVLWVLFHTHCLHFLPSKASGAGKWEMFLLLSPIWDSGNSEKWGLIMFISSTCMPVQPRQWFRAAARLVGCQKWGFKLHYTGLPTSAFNAESFWTFSSWVSHITISPWPAAPQGPDSSSPLQTGSSRHAAECLHHQPSRLWTSTGKQPIHHLSWVVT